MTIEFVEDIIAFHLSIEWLESCDLPASASESNGSSHRESLSSDGQDGCSPLRLSCYCVHLRTSEEWLFCIGCSAISCMAFCTSHSSLPLYMLHSVKGTHACSNSITRQLKSHVTLDGNELCEVTELRLFRSHLLCLCLTLCLEFQRCQLGKRRKQLWFKNTIIQNLFFFSWNPKDENSI